MSHDLLGDSRLFDALLKFDRDIAAQHRTQRCRKCGGRLDSAKYPRKPRGGPSNLDPEYKWRFSFSCGKKNCRKRTTPPSVRYLGRRVYLGAVVVLVSIMIHGITDKRMEELRRTVSATLAARTIRRWQVWWREIFVATVFWKAARGRFSPPVEKRELPGSLLERFEGSERKGLTSLLEFLSPLSITSAMAA